VTGKGMITGQEAANGLYAAWRLLLRDRSAVKLLDGSPTGAMKSFFCALIVLPVHVFLIFVGPTMPEDISMSRLLLVDLIAFVIDWTAWPLVMAFIAPAIQRDDDYCRYIAAHNWAAGPQYLLFFVVATLFGLGLVTKPVFQVLAVSIFLIVLFYHLFIIREVLRVNVSTGLGILVTSAVLGMIISVMRASLLV
jgi:hypothetical protein